MEKKENILQELQQISVAVATISNRNVHTIPAGYFDTLADNMLAGVQMAHRPVMPVPYTVPSGYFDNLAVVILQKVHALELAETLSPATGEPGEIALLLHSIRDKNPYSMPTGYFESLAANTVQKIREAEIAEVQAEVYKELELVAPLLNTISKKSPYSLPAGYFESLTGTFIDNTDIKDAGTEYNEVYDELEQLAPVLNSISKAGPYNLPENYFDKFVINIGAENTEAKVVRMHRHKMRLVTWLAAACITAVLATGGFLIWQGNNKVVAPASFNGSLSEVSDEDINNYLNSMPAPGPETLPSSILDENAPDLEPVIQNLSTQEIKDYLDSNSDPGENSAKDI